jgi:hypothetical protein
LCPDLTATPSNARAPHRESKSLGTAEAFQAAKKNDDQYDENDAGYYGGEGLGVVIVILLILILLGRICGGSPDVPGARLL